MVKAQVEEFGCVRGRRGRPGDTKATVDSKDQLIQMTFYRGLRDSCLKRDDDI